MPDHPNSPRTRRVAVTLAAVASLALAGGTLASFSDRDTTTPQILTAGTVAVDAVEGAGWATNLSNLAVGDTFTKTATLENTSTLGIGRITLSADLTDTPGEFGGHLSEAVTVDITQQAAGALPAATLATDVPLADLADGYELALGAGLPAGTDLDLSFAYEVTGARAGVLGDRTRGHRETPSNPDNPYQGSSLRIAYTIDAIQRAGADLDGPVAAASKRVIEWGTYNASPLIPPPATAPTAIDIAPGRDHTLVLLPDGTVTGWGYNASGQATAPAGLADVVSVAAGINHSMALRSDGTVVAWGQDLEGETRVPAGLSDVVAIDGGGLASYALRSNGTVVAWGWNQYGQTTPPAGLSGVTKISAGTYHVMALRSDGTVTAWGRNLEGQTSVPSGLSDVVDIAAGHGFSAALRANGDVVLWGNALTGATQAGTTHIQAIAADNHMASLGEDGSVHVWGDSRALTPPAVTGVTKIAVGGHRTTVLAD